MLENNEYKILVSIVIPVYNGSNYVKEAIDSALSQTYKNVEIIVINDGSNDKGKTDKICKSYGNKIRYFVKENGGVSSALNMGIEKMEGEYFSWLSHDDVYYPDKVEKQIKYLSELEDRNKVVLYSDYELIDKNSKFLQKVILNHKELTEKPEYSLLRGSVNGITLLIPKSAFDKYGNFNEQLKVTQDYDMWRRIMKTYKFVHMDDIFTKTRIHALQDSNKHPNIQREGDELWISMIESIDDTRKKELEGSIYNYYLEMISYLKKSPYLSALDYARNKLQEIYHNKMNVAKQIKVSVIIPFFNRVSFTIRAIDSVINQTHKNWELILVNDGSKENINPIVEKIKKNKRIELINVKGNKGPAFARNIGINKATGEYIAFLDSDDEFLPQKLDKQLTEMYLSTYNVSHTSYIRRNKGGDKDIEVGKLTGTVILQIIRSCQIATPTVMIKTEFLKKNNFRFREDIRIGEDTCFWLELLRNTKLLGIEEPLTIVNISDKSSANDSKKHLEGLTNILSFLLSDKEYSKYHEEISNLCRRYAEISEEIVTGKESGYILEEKLASMSKFSKLIYLFKYQGVFLTLKKIIWKYGPRAINKVKSVINGKR